MLYRHRLVRRLGNERHVTLEHFVGSCCHALAAAHPCHCISTMYAKVHATGVSCVPSAREDVREARVSEEKRSYFSFIEGMPPRSEERAPNGRNRRRGCREHATPAPPRCPCTRALPNAVQARAP